MPQALPAFGRQKALLLAKLAKGLGLDGVANIAHKLLIKVQIMSGVEDRTEDFPRFIQMAQIGARVVAAGAAVAFGVQRTRVLLVALIADVDGPL